MKLTPAIIIEEERRSAEHYEELAAKARKAGDGASAAEYLSIANIARRQLSRVEKEAFAHA